MRWPDYGWLGHLEDLLGFLGDVGGFWLALGGRWRMPRVAFGDTLGGPCVFLGRSLGTSGDTWSALCVCVCGGVLFRGSVGDQLATAENDFDSIFTYPKRHSGNIQIKQAFVFRRHYGFLGIF